MEVVTHRGSSQNSNSVHARSRCIRLKILIKLKVELKTSNQVENVHRDRILPWKPYSSTLSVEWLFSEMFDGIWGTEQCFFTERVREDLPMVESP